MSLSYTLLTSLLEKPSSGIELARRFDKSMGYFWHATHQQIYRELNQMLKLGWISTLESADYQGRKKTYQVEASGRQALAEWLLQQSQPAQLREELMVRLRAEAQLKQHHIMPELQRHLALHQQNLATYQLIYQRDFAQASATDRTLLIHRMILQLGINLEQTWIDWLQLFIPQLQHIDQPQKCDNN
ncbi:PadR family transcriptional regulator [Acinetobacter larvae]|uniref:PadR family transcriptional regulator n=1 Tax=Acinetobacter larvae TaxID=1789224 RepID=A0A1B2LZS0_9GAMM|nr:PadR family transcriptional regulator [Acinetobacter larvae]AOA58440.1 PadR family transcriptional regulator [Acinetobacter larvae]